MKIEHVQILDNILRITTYDERWYKFNEEEFVPSVTWITSFYPKGIQFMKWLASKGWDEAEIIKSARGNHGSKVHQAIEDLITGKKHEVIHDSKYINNDTGILEELTVDEYASVISFNEWFKEVKPKVILTEVTVLSRKHNYAGTDDIICKIDDDVWLIDYKISPNIYPSHEIQLSAYKNADVYLDKDGKEHSIADLGITKQGILQLGYKRNKKGYKFTEILDQFDLFLATKKIWAKETAGQQPLQKDYPLSIKLGE